jgi:zinc transporter 1
LSYGWGRAELLGGLINGVFLISVVLFIYLEAAQRFFEPTRIENPLMILIVGVAGMIVNIIGMIMFCGHAHHHHGHDHGHDHGHGHSHEDHDHEHEHSHDDEHGHDDHHRHNHSHSHSHKHINFNMLGVFLHVLGDFLGSIGVVITAGLLLIFKDPVKHKWTLYIDPLVSSILATIILASSIPLVISCAKILLQRVPNHVQLKKVKQEIMAVEGVFNVHELHVWQFVNNRVICSVHVKTDESREFIPIATEIQNIMHKYGVHSTTIQPEPVKGPKSVALKSAQCAITCSSTDCQPDWCCPPPQQGANKQATPQTDK